MAGRVDRDDADARRRSRSSRPSCCCSRPGSWRRSRPGFDESRARADHRADPDHGPRAAVPRGRRRGHQRAQRAGPVRGGGDGAARRTTSGSSAGRCSSCPCSASRASRSASSSAPPATCSSRCPTMRRIGARIRPRVDLGDPQARRTLVLMAPRALGLGATQVVFLVMTSLASTLPTGSIADLQLRVRDPPDPDRRDRRAAGRRAAAVAVAPGRDRRRRTPSGTCWSAGCRCSRYVMLAITALGIALSQDVVQLLFGFVGVGQAALDADRRRRSRSSSSGSPRTR